MSATLAPERVADVALTAEESELLLQLLELPTAGPLEVDGGAPVRLWEAQRAYAAAAHRVGFETVRHGGAAPDEIGDAQVPTAVRRAFARDPRFLEDQPSLVLRLGPQLPRAATVMFNVHLDTVAGRQPVRLENDRFHGRGAVDAKGPAVGLLAGIRAAIGAEPRIGREVGVLIQAVAGEEGGAMGVFGTRPLVREGWTGRLNIFCEPTGRRLLTRSTAAMTARIVVEGEDAIDDAPFAGHNATALLGHLACRLAEVLPATAGDGQVCLAGLETGPLHNKVYGTGQLLLNLSYGSARQGRVQEQALTEALAEGIADFRARYWDNPLLARTAQDAERIVRLEWLKRGLPALHSADPWMERLLTEDVGLTPWPATEPAFTCDAIWTDGLPDAFTAVYGPGDLERNNAHAEGEFIDRRELEEFAADISRLLVTFARS